MNKYKTANGTIATEQELRSYYGSRFEEMLASGAFVKVEDGAELKKKVSPVLPMAPQQEQVPNAIPGVQPYTGSPSEDTSLDSQSSQNNPIPVRPTDVPPVRQQMDQTPLGVFNQKIADPNYDALTPDEQARSVKIKYPTTKEEPKKEETPKEEKSTLESVGDWINNTAAALDRGFAKNIIGNPIKGLGTLIQGLNAKVTGTSGKEPITDALIKFGDYYNKMIDELAPQDEEYKNSLSDQFSQAFGQVASLIVTGGAAKVAGAAGKSTSALQMAELASQTAPKAAGVVSGALKTVGAELSAPTSISAGLSMGQAEFDRAKASGATDDQAYEAFLKNASVGSILETIPVMGFLKRFDKVTAGGVKNYLKTKTISGLVGGTEEMTTEILQQLYSNKTAKDIYNTNQDLFEGVGESGGVGFGVGFLLNAMGANAKILRKEGKKTEAAIIEKQMQEFQEKPKGPPPSYKLNGIVLNPDIAPDLLDKMSGAELIKSKLDIKNDPILELKIQDKIVSNSVKEQVRQGNPNLNEPSLNAITDLEVQLKKLEGNTTQTGKDKAAAVRSQIKDIQENQLQEEAKVATIEAEAPEITTKRADKIAELETSIADENIPAEIKPALKTELETLKKEQDAIQKQSTNEGVLRTGQPELGLQEVGKGNVQPEVTTTGTEEVIAEQPKQEEVKFGTAFEMQDNTAENTVGKNKDNWGESQVWRERIENAGDILRELSSRGESPDAGYIIEKVNKLKDWIERNKKYPSEKIPNEIKTIEDFKNSKLKNTNALDSYEYLNKFHSDILEKIKKEYESINTYTKEQRLAVDLTLDLINNNLNGLDSKLNDIENIANQIKKEGKLKTIPDIKLGLQLQPKEASLKIEPIISESELPGYDRMIQQVDGIIEKSKQRAVPNEKVKENVMDYVVKSKVYEKATDVQREKLVRDVNKMFGVKEKAAPSVGKILGSIKDVAKITITEKQGLIKQIKDLARGAKDAKIAINIASQQLSKEVKELVGQGKLTVNQAANVVRKFSKVNVLSQKSINSFTDYMTKVFENADYVSKLNQANSLKKDISKFSKDKNKNANLRDMAQKFAKIDPSMVEDIDGYNDMASKLKEAVKGSTIRKEKVTFADTVNIENATDYITETLTAQDEKAREQKAEEIQDLMGIDVSDLSYEQMMKLLDSKQPITKYNEGIIRDTIQKMFDIYSSIINATIKTGKDQFNDEDVEFTKNQKSLIKRFMDMDLSLLKPKEALQAVDALANFLENKSTAKMETVLSEYTANFNAKKLVEKGVVAQPLKKYWSERIGRFLGEQTTNLNVLFEKMFKGFNRGGEVEDAMGVTKLKNNKSMAQREANNIVDKYVNQFYDKKANGEAYNSEYNSVERGLTAFMMRNVIGTENEMQDEFNRRKGLIEESINVLSQGNEQEQKKGELYKKVYDKILKDSQSIQAVKDKTDNTNLDGIDFWNKEWSDKYEQLSDVSENVYNKVLDKDLNYTPDKFVKLSSETGNVELNNDESAFHNNNGTIYKKETGVLMTAVKPESLPTNPKSGDTNMFIDLSFDKNNANAMYDALIDMGTAAPIRQIEAFLNSSDFKKIIPKAEDAKILKDRIQLYVGNIRNKNPYSNDELSVAVRSLNRIANIGVGQALGGVLQPFKQVIPVAMNTLVNAGGLDMVAMFSASKNSFINRTGYAISNRGIESQAQVESLNKLIDEASKSKGQALVKKVEQLNKWWLEKFLVKPDLFIARASWITYYEQSLKKQGIDTKGIDYNTHEVNEQAADFAQRMVDRQQNVSDSDLAGKMFSNKESSNQLFVKILMPFASFRMNQSARLGADLAVLSDKTSTQEDKKIAIRSLSGFAVEMVTFKMVAAGSAILLGSLAKMAIGDDEDDEEYKKRVNNVIKGQVTSSFTDIMSPLPILDKAYQKGGNFLTETLLDIPKESVFSIYGVPKQEYVQSLGLFGIAADRASQLYDISKLATTGEYTDEYGKVKQISEKNKENLGYLIGPAILSNVGLAPVEVNSIVKNAIKDAKKGKGKSTEEKADAVERKEQKQEDIDQKVEALDKIREDVSSSKELDAIDEKINELEATTEERKVIAEENRAERELKKELLTDPNTGKEYDNESDLKRYQPSIYEKNFGEQSDWYKNHQDEKDVEKRLREELKRQKDEEEGYIPVSKKRKNSDGTFKRSTFGPQKEGKKSSQFGPQKRTSKSVFGPR